MKKEMTHAARAELADAIRDRYLAAAGKDKGRSAAITGRLVSIISTDDQAARR
jgi:hypothetical protein